MESKEIFNNKIQGLRDYIKKYNLKTLVLGISGGIDSTITAIIAIKAIQDTDCKLIGRSLPCKSNSNEELEAALKVGTAFCSSYKTINIEELYSFVSEAFQFMDNYDDCNKIPEGNIKARLRMIYLYNLAWYTRGIVLDTDNLTEHNLGFFTIHGDVGDIGVLNDLYKTEVIELGYWILVNAKLNLEQKHALAASLDLEPTDGNGTDPDLVQYGEPTFERVDSVLRKITKNGYISAEDKFDHPILTQRYKNSWFKREPGPLHIGKDGLIYNAIQETV